MLIFLSYLLLFAGSFLVTAAFLKRFTYRRRLIFDLNGWQRLLAFVAGVLLLLACIYLYVYGNVAAAAAEAAKSLAP